MGGAAEGEGHDRGPLSEHDLELGIKGVVVEVRAAEQAGATDAAQLAMRLALVAEGASTLAFLGDRTEVIDVARQLAQQLIRTACRS